MAVKNSLTVNRNLIYFLNIFLSCISQLNATDLQSNCPALCKCFFVNREVTKVLMGRHARVAINVTSCQRAGLKTVPLGISKEVTDLYLTYNELTNINASFFHGLERLQVLDLSYNQIRNIDADAFDRLVNLEYVDLSYNQLQSIPDAVFCPWQYRMKHSCQPINKPEATLRLRVEGNQWECGCPLQKFIVENDCELSTRRYNSSCIEFLPALKTADIPRVYMNSYNRFRPIAFCHTPYFLQGFPINRLSSVKEPVAHIQLVNMCMEQKGSVDYVMLVVVFSWIGATVAYVLHFISWNNREVARHKNYISSLSSDKVKNQTPEATFGSSQSLSDKNQELKVHLLSKDSVSLQNIDQQEAADNTSENLQLNTRSTSLAPSRDGSPVWKLQSSFK